MPYDPKIHHRRSIRLPGYDYIQAGVYFVTLCTQGRQCLFGEVVNGAVVLNPLGRIAGACWTRLPRTFLRIELGAWVVMPNHIHGIVLITDVGEGEASLQTRRVDPPGSAIPPALTHRGAPGGCLAAVAASPLHPTGVPAASLGAIIGNYKSVSTRRINAMRHTPGAKLWLRNYWEHIIRNEKTHALIAEYIANNPANWHIDHLHPDAPATLPLE